MRTTTPPPTDAPPAAPAAPKPAPTRHRSGAVARMLRMPVATLRVWERRYAITQPVLSPSGQRLYSAADVQRLALIKQLTELGHAIGSLATLDSAQLQQVAATHARTLDANQAQPRASASASASETGPALPTSPPQAPAWRLLLVGDGWERGARLLTLRRRLGPAVVVLGPCNDAAQAAAASQSEAGHGVDAVLIHATQLHPGWLAAFDAAAPNLARCPKAVLYRYAAEAVCISLADAGVALLREPQSDVVLAQWLHGLRRARTGAMWQPVELPSAAATPAHPVPPRRWDDAALADFAGLSSTVACECPRHLAELLVQLSHFEAYSAECQHRSPVDAALHAYLRQVAATSRAHFETALEHVALHEGLILPPAD